MKCFKTVLLPAVCLAGEKAIVVALVLNYGAVVIDRFHDAF